ncbi:MAG: hypothetical protein JRE40_00110 [Deltaproteobacteria bacterium]|nr:hypothetical protein [Deltaproteobacteria bacterium]
MSPNPFSPKTDKSDAIEIIEKPQVKSVLKEPIKIVFPPPPEIPAPSLFDKDEVEEIREQAEKEETIKRKGNKPDHLWKPGQSGNPAGRPKSNKSRELAGLLTRAGNKRFKFIDEQGKVRRSEYNEFIAERIMDALSTGQVTFPRENLEDHPVVIRLNSSEWMKLVDFFFKQVDGLVPKAGELDKSDDTEINSSDIAKKTEEVRQSRWDSVIAQLGEAIDDEGSDQTSQE